MEEENQKALGSGTALIGKIQTTVDGGLRVTLDFPVSDLEMVQALLRKMSSGDRSVFVAFVDGGE